MSNRILAIAACVLTIALGVAVAQESPKHEEAALPPRSSPVTGSDELLMASKAYEFGDYSTAHGIWLRLAEQENAKAQASLAYLYREGRGVRRDSETAAHWYYRAALQGDPTAQSFLCEMHLRGDGVQRSLELALMWCELSIEGGETRGIWYREEALNQMTAQERDAGWALVVKWRHIQSGAGQADHAGK
jgi:TPR repeat protein